MPNFAASITAPNVTFLGSAVNNGTINGTVTFKGTSQNNGTVNGSANFLEQSWNNGGTVSGGIIYDPPLLASWIKMAFAPGDPWNFRKIQTYRVYGGETNQNHPMQGCPSINDGCYADPDTYRPLVNFNYVLDYANHPEYCAEPGNACAGIVDTPPDPPTGVTGTPRDAAVKLSWSAPANNGGKSITDYIVQLSTNGNTWTNVVDAVSNSAGITVMGLTNGVAYLFRVAAVNEIGTGKYSDASAQIVPLGVPGPPTLVKGDATNAQVSLTWSAPLATGGTPITDYVVQFRQSGKVWKTFADGASNATTATVTGLTNGKKYFFRVAAVNEIGTGQYSEQSAELIPLTVPDAPTGVTGTAGDEEVKLKWSTPAGNGGAPLLTYFIERSTNGTNWVPFGNIPAINNAIVVTGLTNGTPYVFRVTAYNILGAGPPSEPSLSITPRTTPDAPIAVTATAGAGQVELTWAAPISNGGAQITDYRIQFSKDNGISWSIFTDTVSTITTVTVTGLTNGVNYLFRVAAVNLVGLGPYSNNAAAKPRTVPSAPRSVVATPDNAVVSLTWLPPVSNGGEDITQYNIQYSVDANAWLPAGSSTNTTRVVNNLINGTTYFFRITAVNVVGPSTPSNVTPGVTPKTVPDAPLIANAVPGNRLVNLSWAAPASNGGSPITDYKIQFRAISGGDWSIFNDTQSANTTGTITGLTNGVSYVFRVAAVNVVGLSVYSAPSAATTPRTVPGKPTNFVATPGNGLASLSWVPPASNGGSPITDYVIERSTDGLTWYETSNGSPSTVFFVDNLVNGVAYRFRVRARNIAGFSVSPSDTRIITPRTIPDPPTNVVGTAGNGRVNLTWNAPGFNGGSRITDYTVRYKATTDNNWLFFADKTSTATTAAVTGLTNGVSYEFQIAAHNIVGLSAFSSTSAVVTPTA